MPISPPNSLISGGMGSAEYLVQGLHLAHPANAGNVITQGMATGLLVTQGYGAGAAPPGGAVVNDIVHGMWLFGAAHAGRSIVGPGY